MSQQPQRPDRARVVLVGAFDTKAEPMAVLHRELSGRGCAVHRIDFGLDAGSREVETTAETVAGLAGTTVADARARGRAGGLDLMADGVRRRLNELHTAGEVDAVLWAGGSGAGTVFGLTAPVLPFGVPKVVVSTIAAGDTRGYLQGMDALFFYPVVDVEGDNPVLRSVLRRAASATAALAADHAADHASDHAAGAGRRTAGTRPLSVAATMFGITTPGVTAARRLLEERGVEVTVFHANGTGGASLERLVAEGRFDAVLDLTTTELADHVAGGTLSAGPGRLTAAAAAGVPQVVVPGALDTVNFGGPASVPDRFAGRVLHRHNANVTLMRSDADDNAALGALVAERASAAPETTAVVLPLGGFSQLDAPGQPFWSPQADEAFRRALVDHLDPGVRLVESALHVNDEAFAALLVEELLALVGPR